MHLTTAATTNMVTIGPHPNGTVDGIYIIWSQREITITAYCYHNIPLYLLYCLELSLWYGNQSPVQSTLIISNSKVTSNF